MSLDFSLFPSALGRKYKLWYSKEYEVKLGIQSICGNSVTCQDCWITLRPSPKKLPKVGDVSYRDLHDNVEYWRDSYICIVHAMNVKRHKSIGV